MGTRAGPKLSGHLISVRKEFTDKLTERFKFAKNYENMLQSVFVSMDETAICLKQNSIYCKQEWR